MLKRISFVDSIFFFRFTPFALHCSVTFTRGLAPRPSIGATSSATSAPAFRSRCVRAVCRRPRWSIRFQTRCDCALTRVDCWLPNIAVYIFILECCPFPHVYFMCASFAACNEIVALTEQVNVMFCFCSQSNPAHIFAEYAHSPQLLSRAPRLHSSRHASRRTGGAVFCVRLVRVLHDCRRRDHESVRV